MKCSASSIASSRATCSHDNHHGAARARAGARAKGKCGRCGRWFCHLIDAHPCVDCARDVCDSCSWMWRDKTGEGEVTRCNSCYKRRLRLGLDHEEEEQEEEPQRGGNQLQGVLARRSRFEAAYMAWLRSTFWVFLYLEATRAPFRGVISVALCLAIPCVAHFSPIGWFVKA